MLIVTTHDDSDIEWYFLKRREGISAFYKMDVCYYVCKVSNRKGETHYGVVRRVAHQLYSLTDIVPEIQRRLKVLKQKSAQPTTGNSAS
jgi:hypothetical protein